MKSKPISSWLALRLGWNLLNMPNKHNMMYFPRTANHHFFLSLDLPMLPLLPSLSRSKN
jgi:hypothetical protein